MSQNTPNALGSEKSPYLLQHAYNPVQWFPWGQEAFDKAQAEDKPIFLSIGYSTCHWCHVMEQESFENPAVAELLNRDFISIKVDREERPDVDSVYMSVCQAFTGQGGWPLTIIMTPDRKPFFAATYLPERGRRGMYGMMDLLPMVAEQWKNNRDSLLDLGNKTVELLRHQAQSAETGEVSKQLLADAFAIDNKTFDSQNGGFGGAPKFPMAHKLVFLLRYAKAENNPAALEMAEKTLVQMYRGGLFDHIGGGFSRYSTDKKWLVPHFEKMLYDNALLVWAYLEAYQRTGKQLYSQIARKTIDYILTELTDEQGGFYCGQDADSEGVEGKYYVFTPQELADLLGKDPAEQFCRWFDITQAGNFEGKSIPNLLENDEYEKQAETIQTISKQVYQYRLHRTKLHKDDKILCSWNCLMIASLAKAAVVLSDESFLRAAEQAERFLAKKLTQNGRMMVRYRDGDSAGEGKLDDYAFYVFALLELYRTTFRTEYLTKATDMATVMTEQFFDEENGGFYLYAKDAEQLIVRPKELYDGALPSGNSVAAYVLERLAKLTGESRWQTLFDKQISFMVGSMQEYPAGYSVALLACLNALYPSAELVCVNPAQEDVRQIQKLAAEHPALSVLVKTQENAESLTGVAPFTASYSADDGKPQFYLCQNGSCRAPVNNLAELESLL